MGGYRILSMRGGLYTNIPWITFVFLTIVFFLEQHKLLYSLEENFDFAEIEVSSTRHAILISLGLFSMMSLMLKGRKKFEINGFLGWLFIFYVFWSFFSVVWTVDPGMTVKRLTVFLIYCLATLALARRFPVNCIPLFVLLSTTLYLLVGLSAELILGTFHPSSTGYRFTGTTHPNIQGINCALLFLAALSYVGITKRGRGFFLITALVAFILLIFTKSRTAFLSALVAQIIDRGFASSYSKKLIVVLGASWLICFLFLILGDDLISLILSGILLGREDSNVATLTGRTFLWEKCLEYVAERPLLGYGFEAFWTLRQIYSISNSNLVYSAHSAYLELLLNLGLIGMIIYIAIMGLAIRRSFVYYKDTGDVGNCFCFKLWIFYVIHGLTESTLATISPSTFLLLWSLAHLAFLSPRGK